MLKDERHCRQKSARFRALSVSLLLILSMGCERRSSSSTTTNISAAPSTSPEVTVVTAARPVLPDTSARVADAPTAVLDYSLAKSSAKASETRLAEVAATRSLGKRGFGEVLTCGLVPRKVLAAHDKAFIRDAKGTPSMPLKDSMPYFVFEEDEDGRCRIGAVQDASLAQGWVNPDECFLWPNRRLCYPKKYGDVSLTLQADDGTERVLDGTLAAFDPTAQMPWPILGTSKEDGSMFVLADLRCLKGESAVPIRLRGTDDYEIYVLYSQREIDHSLEQLTRLAGILPKMPVADIPRVFGNFLTQNECDFVDLGELSATLDVFPGKSPDFLMRKMLGERLKNVERALGQQIERLLKIGGSTENFNSAHYTYIVPLTDVLGEGGTAL